MTVRQELVEPMRLSSEEYWRCFLSEEYQRCLFVRELRYAKWSQTLERGPIDGFPVTRSVFAEPASFDVPTVVRGMLAYEERGHVVKGSRGRQPDDTEYRFAVRNASRPEALTYEGSIFPDAGRLWLVMRLEVRLFGFGDLIEQRIAFETKRSLWIAARLAELWAKGAGWGGSAKANLSAQADLRFRR